MLVQHCNLITHCIFVGLVTKFMWQVFCSKRIIYRLQMYIYTALNETTQILSPTTFFTIFQQTWFRLLNLRIRAWTNCCGRQHGAHLLDPFFLFFPPRARSDMYNVQEDMHFKIIYFLKQLGYVHFHVCLQRYCEALGILKQATVPTCSTQDASGRPLTAMDKTKDVL